MIRSAPTAAVTALALALAATAALASACGPAGQGELVVPATLDVATYENEVHPYLERRCATLDCHGDPGRPLRLYAETGLRAVGRDRSLPLDADEIAQNIAAIVELDPSADPDHHILVLKPLAPDAGGMEHVGDTIWAARSDPGYVCLREWLAHRGTATSCTDAFTALPF